MTRITKPAPERVDEILDCAMQLFGDQGYEATSIAQIIEKIGISKGAFYHHFSAKEDVLEALAMRIAQTSAEEIRSIVENRAHDPFYRLNKFIAFGRDHKAAQIPQLRRAFEPLFREENLALFYRTHVASKAVIRPMLSALISEGMEDRAFDTPNADHAADIIMALMVTCREYIIAVLFAKNLGEWQEAIDLLEQKLKYLGTVIDRILGLPDGSIDIGNADFLRQTMPVDSATA